MWSLKTSRLAFRNRPCNGVNTFLVCPTDSPGAAHGRAAQGYATTRVSSSCLPPSPPPSGCSTSSHDCVNAPGAIALHIYRGIRGSRYVAYICLIHVFIYVSCSVAERGEATMRRCGRSAVTVEHSLTYLGQSVAPSLTFSSIVQRGARALLQSQGNTQLLKSYWAHKRGFYLINLTVWGGKKPDINIIWYWNKNSSNRLFGSWSFIPLFRIK